VRGFESIDDLCIEEGAADEEEEEDDEEEFDCCEQNLVETSATASKAIVACQCRQLIPFHILSAGLEQQCSALFQTVYKRSCMGFNENTKSIEVQVMTRFAKYFYNCLSIICASKQASKQQNHDLFVCYV
jgi:hypothetical protein